MNLAKILLVRSALVVILVGIASSPALFRYYSLRPIQTLGTSTAILPIPEEGEQEKGRYDLPVRLKIPQIGVDAAIEHVGLTPDEDMEAPSGNRNVSWYRFGARPGNKGSAVIAGHYGRRGKAVFGKLNELKKGDKLYVEDENGSSATFVVRESRSYDPEADASEVFVSNDGGAHLNLITCEGVWDDVSKSYSQRLVVFADRE